MTVVIFRRKVCFAFDRGYPVSDDLVDSDRLGKRRTLGLTTPKQIRFLESRGFKHVGTWQFESARNLIDRIAANNWHVPNGIDPASYEPKVVNNSDVGI